jgi:ligand-binding sensor domain-containing protein
MIASEGSPLTSRDISALAFDSAGRLWVGYFDRGLDILDLEAQRGTHVENDHIFCVNRIVCDRSHDTTAVATANGLVLFDSQGRQRQVLGREEGLIDDHVSDVVLTAEGMTLATPAGITILTPSGARSIYAFHGLVNNHVYSLAAVGSRVLSGTLGGLSLLDDGHVLANFTTANSGLRHNWITAIVPVGDDWFVGTCGAGILRLDRNGNWQSFGDATGPFNVNNNAMLANDAGVYVGTQGQGLYVYDRASGRWNVVTAGLPSLNVTAVALYDGHLYVGTDNGLVRIAGENLRNP